MSEVPTMTDPPILPDRALKACSKASQDKTLQNYGNSTPSRSLFEWMTVLAAWVAVVIAIATAVVQYRQSIIRPALSYGHYGAHFSVQGGTESQVYWRLMIGNQGDAAASEVRIKLLDVPEDAQISSSLEFTIVERTVDTVLLRIALIPPQSAGYLAIHPFPRDRGSLMPYARSVYFAGGHVDREQWMDDFAKTQVFEVLSKTTGYLNGVCGWHRRWDTPVTASDIEWGSHWYSVEDR